MSNETDYKKLWRKEHEENVKLHNLLVQADELLRTQAELIVKIRDGIIKPEEIVALRSKVEEK